MPAAYPINSHQPIIPFDGPPTNESIGSLGQVGVDVNTGSYYQKIAGKWYSLGTGPAAPVLTTLTGATTVDNSAADGVAKNNVTFTALDQNSAGMAASLSLTTGSGTAVLDATTITTNASTGSATVGVSDTVAEAVVVTADGGGGKTATATATFT